MDRAANQIPVPEGYESDAAHRYSLPSKERFGPKNAGAISGVVLDLIEQVNIGLLV